MVCMLFRHILEGPKESETSASFSKYICVCIYRFIAFIIVYIWALSCRAVAALIYKILVKFLFTSQAWDLNSTLKIGILCTGKILNHFGFVICLLGDAWCYIIWLFIFFRVPSKTSVTTSLYTFNLASALILMISTSSYAKLVSEFW